MRLARLVTAVDAHAGGEPGRVIIGGVLDVPGDSMGLIDIRAEVHNGKVTSVTSGTSQPLPLISELR